MPRNAQIWWMNAAQLQKYQRLSESMFKLEKEKQKLVGKAFRKTISREEADRLREVISEFNAKAAERKALEDENPILPENVLRLLTKNK